MNTATATPSGVPYSDIRTFVNANIVGTIDTESARAKIINDQMIRSNVSSADIVTAFRDTATPYTLVQVNTFLEKRNTPTTTANTSGITTSSEYSSADFEKKTAKIGDTVTLKYSFTPDRKCKLLDGRNGGSRAVIAELEQKINATYSFVVKSEHVVPTS